jgi:hypothetical protein
MLDMLIEDAQKGLISRFILKTSIDWVGV